jgi:hypothetical protein
MNEQKTNPLIKLIKKEIISKNYIKNLQKINLKIENF